MQHSAQSVINELSQAVLNSSSFERKTSTNEFVFTNNTFKLKNYEFREASRIIASNIKSLEVNLIDEGEGVYVKVIAGLGEKIETIETKLYFRKELTYSIDNGDNDDNDNVDDNDEDKEIIKINGNYESSKNKVFNGDVYINGNILLKDSAKLNVNGSVYINGNVELKDKRVVFSMFVYIEYQEKNR